MFPQVPQNHITYMPTSHNEFSYGMQPAIQNPPVDKRGILPIQYGHTIAKADSYNLSVDNHWMGLYYILLKSVLKSWKRVIKDTLRKEEPHTNM